MNNKSIKEIYSTANIPQINLEGRINYRIDNQGKKITKLRFRTLLVTAVVLSLSVVFAFAAVKVITNSDGSHTLLNEENDKTWTVKSEITKELDNSLFYSKMFEEMRKLEAVGEEAVVGYYDFDENLEPISYVRPAGERYIINDGNYDVFLDNDNKPDYLDDILEVIQDDFKISTLDFRYLISKEQIDSIIEASALKSEFGDVYTEIVPVDRKFWSVQLDLLTLDMDKFYNASISIFNDSLVNSPGSNSVSFESIMIGERVAMLSKRSDRTYIITLDVNGYGLVFQADPRGNLDNMIEYASMLVEVLERYDNNTTK